MTIEVIVSSEFRVLQLLRVFSTAAYPVCGCNIERIPRSCSAVVQVRLTLFFDQRVMTNVEGK